MREILFRGKYSKKSPDWIEGSFHRDEDTNICEIAYRYYKKEGETKAGIWVYCVVDPETVGQYTGLKDKNGKKIFEGDIVDLFGMKGKVVQECGAFGIAFMKTIDYDLLESKIPFNNSANFCFNDNFISFWEVFWNYEQDDNSLYEVEVIGNVHDNKLEDFENG